MHKLCYSAKPKTLPLEDMQLNVLLVSHRFHLYVIHPSYWQVAGSHVRAITLG